MSNLWAFSTGLSLHHGFGSGEPYTWSICATEVRKVKHLPVVIPASLDAAGTQGQTWFRGYPHDRSIDPTAHWLSSITQVSCQHFPEEFSSRKRKMWECVRADACFALYTHVKACISTKAKWTFVIQIVAFLLIWNLFLNECHRICEKSKVSHCRKFHSTLQKGLINIIDMGAATSSR